MTPKSAPKVNLRAVNNRLGRQKRTGGPVMTPKSAPKVNLRVDKNALGAKNGPEAQK
jgi:hypothetical protein